MITCLAIDDDPLFLKSLQVLFEDMEDLQLIGCFTNSIEGTLEVVRKKPDVLLLDLEMPYLNGFEVLSTLEKKPKIVVISGFLEGKKLPSIGIDKFLEKDVIRNPQVLEIALKEVMHG